MSPWFLERVESVSLSLSVSVSGWLQVFHNRSLPMDGYGRPSVTVTGVSFTSNSVVFNYTVLL